MPQATFSVRMDAGLKQDFDRLCQDFGMTTTTAINIFAKAVVRERKIPFEITASTPQVSQNQALQAFAALRQLAQENGVGDMSLEAINAEIMKTRKENQ